MNCHPREADLHTSEASQGLKDLRYAAAQCIGNHGALLHLLHSLVYASFTASKLGRLQRHECNPYVIKQ